MLNFWYSNKCTREIKLIICIITCVIIYTCSTISQLSTLYTGISLAIGVIFHLLYHFETKLDLKNKYADGFKILFVTIRVLAILFLIIILPKTDKIVLTAQSLGFLCLGLFIVSIYSQRAKRFD